jgi:hypothetical protein
MQLDSSKWSGEGSFTLKLLEFLQRLNEIAFLRVEDAPATRSEADYNFISNEIYVAFAEDKRAAAGRRFGIFPTTRTVTEKRCSMPQLAERLAADADLGPADYADEGMIQYLKSERIIPPYQTRGYKLVELIRIYEAGATPKR